MYILIWQIFKNWIEEKGLIKQLEDVFDKIDLDEIGMKEKIKDEVNRFKRFQIGVLGVKDSTSVGDVDIRNYAKYILRDGKDIEKRELLGCLKSKILLDNKIIRILKE